jgi:hypothetical protein
MEGGREDGGRTGVLGAYQTPGCYWSVLMIQPTVAALDPVVMTLTGPPLEPL